MSNSSVNQARPVAPAHQSAIPGAPLRATWAAEVQLGKLQGEHDAIEDVRDRVAGYLDVAKRTLPGAAGQLQTFLATQSSGIMAIQAGLPPPPEPPMNPSARELLELHDFAQKLDAQWSNFHSRLAGVAPPGAHAAGKTTRSMLKAEVQAGTYKLRGLAMLMDNACLEMPEAHRELKRYVDALPGRAHAAGDLSIKATILLNMLTASAECNTQCEETARKLRDLEGRPANDSYDLESKPALQGLPATSANGGREQAHATRLGNLQTNHLENLELQAGVERQFIQLTGDHPEAARAMWAFLEQKSYADVKSISAETGYLVPGFNDLPAQVRSLVELHAQCLAISADCTHTESQILDLGARSRVLGARQKKPANMDDSSEQGKRKAQIERNKEDIRKAYLVVTGLSVTNPEVLDELRAHRQAMSSARPVGNVTLSQQARVVLFYDSVRKEKYRDNAKLQAKVNALDSAARRATVLGPKIQDTGTYTG